MRPTIKSTIAGFALLALGTLAASDRTQSSAGAIDRAPVRDVPAQDAVAPRTSELARRDASPAVPARAREPWIEPGTPAEYLRPYLRGSVPVAIHRDGRQVYDGVSMVVRDPDGSTRSVETRVELEPAAVAPLIPAEASASAR